LKIELFQKKAQDGLGEVLVDFFVAEMKCFELVSDQISQEPGTV
jgi:hypothetical protein